ncbi:MAG: low temperature requirement protein A [Burkholderiaceae bacterium]|nr:low temperature requirement protein A [Microbacteriaceae bacterium]
MTDSKKPLGLRHDLFRPEGAGRRERVTFVELFFDLIFVFALTQLSRYLYENQSPLGALEAAVLVLALWWVWIYTTWVTNLLDPERLPVRGAVIALAGLGFIVSVSIFESFGDRGLAFALAYVLMQLGRTMFMALAVARHEPGLHRDFVVVLRWLLLASVLWIAGALLPLEFRLPVWIVALGIEYFSASRGFRSPEGASGDRSDRGLSGAHIAERSALFVLIALGESFLVTGFSFVEQEVSAEGIVGVTAAFVTAVMMWWLYFDKGEGVGSRAIERSENPDRIARLAYTYVHAVIVAGVVLTSVADKEVLEHPLDPMSLSTAVTVAGGPLLYLVGLALFRLVVAGAVPRSHLTGCVALVGAFAAAFLMAPIVLGIVVTGILVAVAVWDTTSRVRHTMSREDAAG